MHASMTASSTVGNSGKLLHTSSRDYVGIADSRIVLPIIFTELVLQTAIMGKKPSNYKLPAWAKRSNLANLGNVMYQFLAFLGLNRNAMLVALAETTYSLCGQT